MSRTQSKDHNIGSYRINKISLPSCIDKKYTCVLTILTNYTYRWI